MSDLPESIVPSSDNSKRIRLTLTANIYATHADATISVVPHDITGRLDKPLAFDGVPVVDSAGAVWVAFAISDLSPVPKVSLFRAARALSDAMMASFDHLTAARKALLLCAAALVGLQVRA